MEKRRILKDCKALGMRLNVNDIIVMYEDHFLVIYTDDDSLVPICLVVDFKERFATKKEMESYRYNIIKNSEKDERV